LAAERRPIQKENGMSQPPAKPMTALSPEYITALRERDEPVNAADPEAVGPWRIREADGRFHLFREWERFEMGHTPVASFMNREDALLFSIALRVGGRAATFRVRDAGAIGPEGHRLEREGELVGSLKMDRAELLVIAHALASVARSPLDLAILFELAGSEVQEMTGEILGQEVLGDEDETLGA
jgi:hypothetical protein